MGDGIRVNGNQYDYGSARIKVAGEVLHGITGIKYSQKRERPMGYGQGRHHAPRGRGRGKYSAEGGLTMYRSSARELRKLLAAQSADGVSYGDVEFQVVGQWSETGEGEDKVELFNCVIAGEDGGSEEGGDLDKEEIALNVMYIKKNGRTLFDNVDGVR